VVPIDTSEGGQSKNIFSQILCRKIHIGVAAERKYKWIKKKKQWSLFIVSYLTRVGRFFMPVLVAGMDVSIVTIAALINPIVVMYSNVCGQIG
jgi:hypothetical protein